MEQTPYQHTPISNNWKDQMRGLASQYTSAQLGFQGSTRRLLGGIARELAAADDEDDESYDDDLDIDEPLTAGQANPFLPLPMCFLHSRRIALTRRHS